MKQATVLVLYLDFFRPSLLSASATFFLVIYTEAQMQLGGMQ